MPPYDPLYRSQAEHWQTGRRSGRYPSPPQQVASHWPGRYTPISTGYALQQNAHGFSPTEEPPALYEPPHLRYESEPRDYESVDPWSEPVVSSTPPLRFPAPAEDDVRPPEYEGSLMDDWLMARAMDETDENLGTLDDMVNAEDEISLMPHDAELDRLAAGMDPKAPEAFSRLCDLPIDELDEDQLFSAAAMLRLFAPPGALGPGPGPLI